MISNLPCYSSIITLYFNREYYINFACCRERCPLSNCREENKRENESRIPTPKRFYVLEFLKRTNEIQSMRPCRKHCRVPNIKFFRKKEKVTIRLKMLILLVPGSFIDKTKILFNILFLFSSRMYKSD